MEKRELRKHFIEKRNKFTKEEISEKSLYIQNIFLNSKLYKESKIICCYIDYNNEVKTDYIIKKSLEDRKKVYVPKILKNNEMEFFLIDSDSKFVENKYKIKEPNGCTQKFQSMDFPSVFLVPGVAFSRYKYRIGYGGGFYDKWIEKNPKNIYIGLSYEMQIIDKFNENIYDKKVDYIITEKGFK